MSGGSLGLPRFLAEAVCILGPVFAVQAVFDRLLGWHPLTAWLPALMTGWSVRLWYGARLAAARQPGQLVRPLVTVGLSYGAGLAVLLVVRAAMLRLGMFPAGALAVAFLLAVLVVVLGAASVGDHLLEQAFIRGRRLVGARQADQVHRRAASREGETHQPRPIWGGQALPAEVATTHFLAAGMTGSGKTTIIAALMKSVLPAIRDCPDLRAFVYDDKQEYYSLVHGLVGPEHLITLNPLDQRGLAWDIAADVQDEAVARQTATILVPPDPHASQPFFADAARDLVAAAMLALQHQAPGQWTFRDLLLACDSPRLLRALLVKTAAGRNVEQLYFGNRKTGSDIVATLRTKTQVYRPLAAGWDSAEERYAVSRWVEDRKVLHLANDDQVPDVIGPVNAALVNRLGQLLLARPEGVTDRTWLFFDELREAAQFGGVPSLLNRGRSMGLTLVLGFQSMDGLVARYEEPVAYEMAGECGCVAWLKLNTERSCQWASEAIGSVEQWEHKRSWSQEGLSASEERVERPLVTPSELRDLPLPPRTGRLAGWYLTPYAGPYHRVLNRRQVEALRPVRPLTDDGQPVADFVRRTPEQLVLRPWDQSDMARLKLPVALLSDSERRRERSGKASQAQSKLPAPGAAPQPSLPGVDHESDADAQPSPVQLPQTRLHGQTEESPPARE